MASSACHVGHEPSAHQDPDGDPGVFPIMELPREIRDLIYECALETRATFFLGHAGSVGGDFSLPILATSEFAGVSTEEKTIGEYEDGLGINARLRRRGFFDGHRPEAAWIDRVAYTKVLAYKLTTSAPFLYTNRCISSEVQDTVNRVHSRLHALFASTIHGRRIISPSRLFLDVCSQSRFVFGANGVTQDLEFLYELPESMRSHVKDIAISSTEDPGEVIADGRSWMLSSEDYSRAALVDFLGANFDLNALALFIPTRPQRNPSVGHASMLVCRMLSKKKVQVVRFLYTGYPDADGTRPSHSCKYLDKIMGSVHNQLGPSTGEDDPRKFDAVVETVGLKQEEYGKSNVDKITDIVRITRRTDTTSGRSYEEEKLLELMWMGS